MWEHNLNLYFHSSLFKTQSSLYTLKQSTCRLIKYNEYVICQFGQTRLLYIYIYCIFTLYLEIKFTCNVLVPLSAFLYTN